MNIFSVDAATRAGWAIIAREEGRERVATYGTARSTATSIRQLVAHVVSLNVTEAVIEEPYLGLNPATAIVLGRIVGWWEHELSREGLSVQLVKADAWQKGMLLGLMGHTSKREQRKRAAVLWVRSAYGLEVSEDEADAITMGTWAVRHGNIAGLTAAAKLKRFASSPRRPGLRPK